MNHNPHEKRIHTQIESVSEEGLLSKALLETGQLLREHQINIEDFRGKGKYDSDTIAEHLAFVEQKKRKFEMSATDESRDSQELATIFEGMFYKGAHEYGWLGDPTLVRVIKTCDFDDLKNGIDGIVEFTQEGRGAEHLAVGVDVTYSNQLKEKFKKIKNDIAEGKLSSIEYFRSGNFIGSLNNVPRVIVGAERKNLIELCRDVFVKKDSQKLKRHPFQVLQLKQMRLQLDAFADYAESLGKKDVAALYRRDAEIIRKILQKKSVGEGVRMGQWENDRVFAAIKQEPENLK